MKKIRRCMAALLLFLLVAALLISCADKCEDDGAELDYSGLDLDSGVKLGEYTGLEIELPAGESKSAAIWKLTVDGTQVLDYPEAAVE